MSFSLARNDQVVEVTLEGQLVAADRLELKQAIVQELERGGRLFRIDFEHTRYIDSAGLAALVSLNKRIRDAEADLRLAHLNRELRTLFQLTKLDVLFRLDEDGGTAGRTAPLEPDASGPLRGHEDVGSP
jgi:anti-sigma B factor antagonist